MNEFLVLNHYNCFLSSCGWFLTHCVCTLGCDRHLLPWWPFLFRLLGLFSTFSFLALSTQCPQLLILIWGEKLFGLRSVQLLFKPEGARQEVKLDSVTTINQLHSRHGYIELCVVLLFIVCVVALCGDFEDSFQDGHCILYIALLLLPLNVKVPKSVWMKVQTCSLNCILKHSANLQWRLW